MAKHNINLIFNTDAVFKAIFNGSFNRIDAFLRDQSNLKSADRWFAPFEEGSPASLNIVYPLFRRGKPKKSGAAPDFVPSPPLTVQRPPVTSSTAKESVTWDKVVAGTMLRVRASPVLLTQFDFISMKSRCSEA